MNAATRAATLLAQDITGTRQTNTTRVLDGLEIARAALGHDRQSCIVRDLLTGLRTLYSVSLQANQAEAVEHVFDAATRLADYVGPEDAGNSDAAYDEWKEGRL